MYNNYGYNPYVQPNYDRVDAQIRQLQELKNQMEQQNYNYSSQQPQTNVAMSNRGTYVYVQDYQEVVNYPTPADGNAVLFFNLDNGILWSKKFVNGSNSIQAFTIAPLNSVGNDNAEAKPKNDNISLESPKNDEIIDNILTRMTSLEDKLDEILKPKKTIKKE